MKRVAREKGSGTLAVPTSNEPQKNQNEHRKWYDCSKYLSPVDQVFWFRSKRVVVRFDCKPPQTKSCPKECGHKNVPGLCRDGGWRAESLGMWEQARGIRQPTGNCEETWSELETGEFYKKVLADAGEIAKRSMSGSFEESRKKTWAEFGAFIRRIGRGMTIENARGIDVVAFVHGD